MNGSQLLVIAQLAMTARYVRVRLLRRRLRSMHFTLILRWSGTPQKIRPLLQMMLGQVVAKKSGGSVGTMLFINGVQPSEVGLLVMAVQRAQVRSLRQKPRCSLYTPASRPNGTRRR